jgi:hypothetical protein
VNETVRVGKQHLELVCGEHGSHWIRPLRAYARAIRRDGKVVSHEFADEVEGPWVRCTTPASEPATSYSDQRDLEATR